MSLGGNIKKLRTGKNISLENFAEQLGLSMDACTAIEDDKRSLSSVEIQHICQILDVNFDSLVSEKKSSLEEKKVSLEENAPSAEGGYTEESVLMPVEELQKLLVEMKDESKE